MRTSEQKFKELINDLYTGDYSITITLDNNNKNIKFYNNKGQWFIDHNQTSGWTWIKYDTLWNIFYNEYNMTYTEIQHFMKEMLLAHFKTKGTKPCGTFAYCIQQDKK